MYRSMLDTLARLHSVDVDRAGLGDYGVRVGSTTGTSSPMGGKLLLSLLKEMSCLKEEFVNEAACVTCPRLPLGGSCSSSLLRPN